MEPMLLGGGIHDQQVAVGQFQAEGGAIAGAGGGRFGPKTQAAAYPQAEGGDGVIGRQLRFIIGMPAHAIEAISIAIQQQAVEATGQG